ncbi:MAG: pyridoxamine 5-phosphate oxidase-related FMN-binding protein [Firmicutes bacterium]|nr:pyridoxamine 5-phosphate oxidase-related FMN-binding protein [Bacillota bacterium]
MMNLKEYFSSIKGTGVLSTADDKWEVNAAVYATPHFMEEGLIAFIMRENKTYRNISSNPHACFLFIEDGKMDGKRLYLTKVKEEKNTELLHSLRKRKYQDDDTKNLYLVYFTVDKVRPLIGDQEK